MRAAITYTDMNGTPAGALTGCTLDIETGGSNSFKLVIPVTVHLDAGAIVGVEGAEYGGILSKIESKQNGQTVTWSGDTFAQMLTNKIVKPDDGKDYLVLSGDIHMVAKQLFERAGLSDLFVASSKYSGYIIDNFQFARYITLYEALAKVAQSVGLKWRYEWTGQEVLVWVEAAKTFDVDTDLYPIEITRVYRSVNHLVCLGSGDLKDRVRVDLYADADGSISTQQSLFGVDEVEEVYENTNATAEELEEKGREKLAEYQDRTEVGMTNLEGVDDAYFIGDSFSAYDPYSDTTAVSEITAKVFKVDTKGNASIEYETGSIYVTQQTSLR